MCCSNISVLRVMDNRNHVVCIASVSPIKSCFFFAAFFFNLAVLPANAYIHTLGSPAHAMAWIQSDQAENC